MIQKLLELQAQHPPVDHSSQLKLVELSISGMSRTIVFDNGAGSLKAGTAGDKRPSHIIPNYIGRVKGQVCTATVLSPTPSDVKLKPPRLDHQLNVVLKHSAPMKAAVAHVFDDFVPIG